MLKKGLVAAGLVASLMCLFAFREELGWGGREVNKEALLITESEPAADIQAPSAPVRSTSTALIASVESRNEKDGSLPLTLAELRARAAALPEAAEIRPIASSDVPQDNGMHYFLLASELLTDDLQNLIGDKWADLGFEAWRDPEIQALLTEHPELIDAIRKGLETGNAILPEAVNGPNEPLPYLNDWRMLAKLMGMEAQWILDQGDLDGAIAAYLDIVEFANESTHGGTLIGGLVSYQMTGDMMNLMLDQIHESSVEPENYPGLIEQFLELEQGMISAQEMQIYESEGLDSWLVRQFREGADFRTIFATDSFGSSTLATYESQIAGLTDQEIEQRFNEFLEYRQTVVEYAGLPYWELRELESMPTLEDNPFAILVPNVPSIAEADARFSARGRGAALFLGIEQYASEHGEYPASLSDLPSNLQGDSMVDPLTGDAFVYVNNGDDYVLYSPGADGIDNGATPGSGRNDTDLVIHGPRDPEEYMPRGRPEGFVN